MGWGHRVLHTGPRSAVKFCARIRATEIGGLGRERQDGGRDSRCTTWYSGTGARGWLWQMGECLLDRIRDKTVGVVIKRGIGRIRVDAGSGRTSKSSARRHLNIPKDM